MGKRRDRAAPDPADDPHGKQFAAWANSGRAFVPVQLVLDSLTECWYVVPGIPRATLGLDPLADAFDPAEPLSPFKVAEGRPDDLSDGPAFLAVRQRLTAAFARLLLEKESIVKALDADYLVYLESAAEDITANPDLMRTIGRNDEAMRTIGSNDEAMARLAANDEAMARLAANDEAMARLAANDEAMLKLLGAETFAAWKKTRRP